MPRKKTVEEETQEVQTQDTAAPADDMAEDQSWPNDASFDDGAMDGDALTLPDDSLASADFPMAGELPFEDAPDAALPEDNTAGQAEGEPAMAGDYGALFQEMDSAAPIEDSSAVLGSEGGALPDDYSENDPLPSGSNVQQDAGTVEPPTGATRVRPPRITSTPRNAGQVLTINAHDRIQSEQEREEIIWHEIHNAYRTRRMLTGTLDGLERTPSGKTLAVASYKGFRVAIPLQEMLFLPKASDIPSENYRAFMDRQRRNLSNMMGAEIDFIVRGIDSNRRLIVASRKDAMLKKRQVFYMNTDELGEHMIYEGRVVQARVIGVAEKVIRVEAFGVECPIVARDLSWEWLGDAREKYYVGDRILVRILTIDRASLEDLAITADVRSVSSTTNLDNVKKCQVQCRYVGRITDVRLGKVYIRLNNGVNAIAHACYDMRTPGKKDDVSFTVTQLDEEKGIAIGIITRIIKQNL